MESRAGKVGEPGNIRNRGVMENTGGRDNEIYTKRIAFAGGHLPATVPVLGGRNFLIEAHQFSNAVFVGGLLEILANLGAFGKAVIPAHKGFEAIGVHVGGHITAHAGVGVLPPGAAHTIALFHNGDVSDACLAQLDA